MPLEAKGKAESASRHAHSVSPQSVTVDIEDITDVLIRILKTEVHKLRRVGNSLHVTVKARVAKELGLESGDTLMMIHGCTSKEIEAVLTTLSSIENKKGEPLYWILLFKPPQESDAGNV